MQQIKYDGKNFRKHSDENKRMIRRSLEELGAGRSVVIDADNELIAGNGVYEQAEALGLGVKVVETDGSELVVVKRTDLHTEDEKRKRLAFADNATSDHVEWDFGTLEVNIDVETLKAFNVEIPDISLDTDEGNEIIKKEKNAEAEELLNKAMQSYCAELVDRIDVCLAHGFLPTFATPSLARLHFLKAKYYGFRYPRKDSLIFSPRQFLTSAKKRSYYEQMKSSAETGKAGIAGFRTFSGDDDLKVLLSNSYPIGEGRMPLDFPADVARDLIRQFANGGRVLDPCHGWGGRLVGAMLEDVREYVGIDPSDVAHDGVTKLYDTLREYCKTEATLIKKPYEDVKLGGGFDFALTSPPYFDVEQYDGEEQAHVRYSNYELWRESFYKPLILDTMCRLKDGGSFALQVGSQLYPLKNDAERIAREAGYDVTIYKTNILSNGSIHDTEEERSEVILLISK